MGGASLPPSPRPPLPSPCRTPCDAPQAHAGGGAGSGCWLSSRGARREVQGVSELEVRTHRLILMPSGRQGTVPAGMDLLAAARSLGVELESICGGRQTCGKCQLIVEEGTFAKHGITSLADHLSPVGPVEADYCQVNGIAGRRLACAAQVVGDVPVVVSVGSQGPKQFIP